MPLIILTSKKGLIKLLKTKLSVLFAAPSAFNSEPTELEKQRENVNRLKKAFGLSTDEDSRKPCKYR